MVEWLMWLVYRVRERSTLELCQTARCHMGRGTAGDVEGDLALCLLQGGEPLRVPVIAVGALVTDLDSHGLFG